MTIGWRGLVEEDQAASVLAFELGPAGTSRIVPLIEERPREERRSFLVIANDQTVLGCTAQPEDERRKRRVDRLFGTIEDELAHLIVVWRRLRIESHACRARGACERLRVAWRRRQRIPPCFVDRGGEGRARRSHQPVVLRSGRNGERVRKCGVVPFAEP